MPFSPKYRSKLHESLLVQVVTSAGNDPETGYSLIADRELQEIISSKDTETVKTQLYHQTFVLKTQSFNSTAAGETAPREHQVYVKLGLFLAILNRHLKVSETPYFSFALSTGRNYYRTVDGHISVDPSICLLPSTLDGIVDKSDNTVTSPLVYDLYLNVDFIARIIDQHTDRSTEITLLDMFESLFSEVERVTGVINKYELQYYEENSVFSVVDRNHLKQVPGDDFPTLSVFGLDSIVRNISLVTKVSSKLSSMVAIAAQASPFTSNTESTGFNALNADLEQGINNTISDEGIELASSKLQAQQNTYEEVLEDFNTSMNGLLKHLNAIYNLKTFELTDAFAAANIYQNYCQMLIGKKNDPSYSFIIPFELSLELHGVSGLRVLESFKINKNILPATYGGSRDVNVAFVITGVEHQVNRSGWIAKIKTQIYNVNDKGTVNGGEDYRYYWNLTPLGAAGQGGGNSDEVTPNADLFRAELTKLGYQEKGKELSTGGDLTPSIVKAGTAVAKKIKALYPNMSLIFTGGNDVFHQGIQEYTSRHTAGNAIDFVISPDTSTDVANVEKVLQGFSVGTGGDFRFLNEYTNPTKKATGKHFHISWGGPTEGNSSYAAARALSDAGKLTSYFLV